MRNAHSLAPARSPLVVLLSHSGLILCSYPGLFLALQADLDTNYTIAHKRAQKVHQKETQTAAAAVKAAEQKVAQARINQ